MLVCVVVCVNVWKCIAVHGNICGSVWQRVIMRGSERECKEVFVAVCGSLY